MYKRQTEHIGEIIGIVKDLVESGHAYVARNGDVYFRVEVQMAQLAVAGVRLDAEIDVAVARHIGVAGLHPVSYTHLVDMICLPEVPFNVDHFVEKVERMQKEKPSIVIAVSEGCLLYTSRCV